MFVEALGKRKTDLVVDSSSSCKAAMVENYFPDTNGVVPVNSDLKTTETHESSISSSLHKRAAAFIKNGELETVEGEFMKFSTYVIIVFIACNLFDFAKMLG